MGKYIYAIGGYNTSVTKSVLRFDGKTWERICDLTSPRSALRVVLLKAWPDPAYFLSDPPKVSWISMKQSPTKSCKSHKPKSQDKTMRNTVWIRRP